MFAEPIDGIFIWARPPNIEDSLTLAVSAQSKGVVLAPGTVFRPHLERSPWMRFNVAICDEPRITRWLERQLAKAPNQNIEPSDGRPEWADFGPTRVEGEGQKSAQ
jgi:DNA-binding transcriptional MocR family regulator